MISCKRTLGWTLCWMMASAAVAAEEPGAPAAADPAAAIPGERARGRRRAGRCPRAVRARDARGRPGRRGDRVRARGDARDRRSRRARAGRAGAAARPGRVRLAGAPGAHPHGGARRHALGDLQRLSRHALGVALDLERQRRHRESAPDLSGRSDLDHAVRDAAPQRGRGRPDALQRAGGARADRCDRGRRARHGDAAAGARAHGARELARDRGPDLARGVRGLRERGEPRSRAAPADARRTRSTSGSARTRSRSGTSSRCSAPTRRCSTPIPARCSATTSTSSAGRRSRETSPETSLAKIRMSTGEIEEGDRVMPREPLPPEIDVKPTPAGVDGKITFFPGHRVVIGYQDFVYLNRGTLDGLEVGSPLEVYRAGYQANEPARDEKVAVPDRVIAKMLVVRTEEQTAVALVTTTDTELELGDHFRGETPQSPRPSACPPGDSRRNAERAILALCHPRARSRGVAVAEARPSGQRRDPRLARAPVRGCAAPARDAARRCARASARSNSLARLPDGAHRAVARPRGRAARAARGGPPAVGLARLPAAARRPRGCAARARGARRSRGALRSPRSRSSAAGPPRRTASKSRGASRASSRRRDW